MYKSPNVIKLKIDHSPENEDSVSFLQNWYIIRRYFSSYMKFVLGLVVYLLFNVIIL